jgi:hypothetical protein
MPGVASGDRRQADANLRNVGGGIGGRQHSHGRRIDPFAEFGKLDARAFYPRISLSRYCGMLAVTRRPPGS